MWLNSQCDHDTVTLGEHTGQKSDTIWVGSRLVVAKNYHSVSITISLEAVFLCLTEINILSYLQANYLQPKRDYTFVLAKASHRTRQQLLCHFATVLCLVSTLASRGRGSGAKFASQSGCRVCFRPSRSFLVSVLGLGGGESSCRSCWV